jgi:hypothetical protein
MLRASLAAARQEFEHLVDWAVRHGRRSSSSHARRAGPALGV